jgi:hypothetical protein
MATFCCSVLSSPVLSPLAEEVSHRQCENRKSRDGVMACFGCRRVSKKKDLTTRTKDEAKIFFFSSFGHCALKGKRRPEKKLACSQKEKHENEV